MAQPQRVPATTPAVQHIRAPVQHPGARLISEDELKTERERWRQTVMHEVWNLENAAFERIHAKLEESKEASEIGELKQSFADLQAKVGPELFAQGAERTQRTKDIEDLRQLLQKLPEASEIGELKQSFADLQATVATGSSKLDSAVEELKVKTASLEAAMTDLKGEMALQLQRQEMQVATSITELHQEIGALNRSVPCIQVPAAKESTEAAEGNASLITAQAELLRQFAELEVSVAGHRDAINALKEQEKDFQSKASHSEVEALQEQVRSLRAVAQGRGELELETSVSKLPAYHGDLDQLSKALAEERSERCAALAEVNRLMESIAKAASENGLYHKHRRGRRPEGTHSNWVKQLEKVLEEIKAAAAAFGRSLDKAEGKLCFATRFASRFLRSNQIQANKALVASSSGMLAEVNGKERAMSISSSHTTAYMKAAMAGCTTADGKKLSADKDGFRELCAEGWGWTMLSWKVEQMLPDLPSWMQMVLNCSNAVAVQMTELEAAQQIGLLVCQGSSLPNAVKTVQSSAPRCSPYLESIGQYVKLFGGGKDGRFPIITFLDSIQKHWGQSVSVGQEMLETIILWNCGEASTQMPLLRAGMLAVQLTAPRVVDGQGRLLTKADLERLRQSNMRDKVLEAEGHLQSGWDIYQAGGSSKMLKAFGRLLVRSVLHLCNKEKSGREAICFDSLASIVRKFTEEAKGQQSSASNASARQEDQVVDLLSMQNAGQQALLQNKHLVVGGKSSN
ncbi:hypothetical protein AK812_SmicGene41254 [Symbiodinium microadriaticum]|uniref:Uncharacterized protein n=1 Tax=Symbiodinium microadriaticum TaxID=2951 RepID=A0A1Q9C6K3_SYMMI|nr:hypothetical protein AK812_SmicGene41254 [Symbiodinium microadriaticum]